jgi:hypothetical protein
MECWGCTGNRKNRCANTVVSAYVRLGNPAKWTKLGEVCIDCGKLTFLNPPLEQKPTPKKRTRP